MASGGSAAVRIALVAVSLAAAIAVATWQRQEDRCREAGATVVRAIGGSETDASLAGATDTLTGDCHDSRPLLVAAGQLAQADRGTEALPLARLAVRREPDNFATWAILSGAESDPAAARRARRRALELNPRAAR